MIALIAIFAVLTVCGFWFGPAAAGFLSLVMTVIMSAGWWVMREQDRIHQQQRQVPGTKTQQPPPTCSDLDKHECEAAQHKL
jgi:hypothetical protein